MRSVKLTVLTEPVPDPGKKYGGHFAVTRSLVEGLNKLGASFNYNPGSLSEMGKTVMVLSGTKTLEQAIQWKSNGYIDRLLAGPNIMTVRATGFRELISAPEIDICIVPSDWVRAAYEETAPALAGRIQCWYAGVDECYWKPPGKSLKSKIVPVYWKTEPEEFNLRAETILSQHGLNPVRIIYGSYSAEQFKEVLSKSIFAVFLSKSESQGIALAESWSMDVPTLVWWPRELVIEGRKYDPFSSCPYLSHSTGLRWTTARELDWLLTSLQPNVFRPRKWVLENMTDEISAKKLLDIAFNPSL